MLNYVASKKLLRNYSRIIICVEYIIYIRNLWIVLIFTYVRCFSHLFGASKLFAFTDHVC